MADEEKEPQEEASEDAGQEKKSEGKKKGLLPWIILAVVVPLCAGMGFGLGRLLAGPKVELVEEEPEEETPDLPDYMNLMDPKGNAKDTWFHELDAVVANLNDPGASRYIRVSFTLEMNGKMPQEKTIAYLAKENYVIKDLIYKYLAAQSLKDMQGGRNLNRVPIEIKDLLNQAVFPDMEPPIVNVLYREHAIQ